MPPPTKRRKVNAVEEISFDCSAREDYLSGFHKRKLQRIKQAQNENAKRAREEAVQHRKEIREERKKALEEHVETVNAMIQKAEDSDAEDEGDDDFESRPDGATDDAAKSVPQIQADALVRPREEEYIDEDKYTTVTVKTMDTSGSEESGSEGEQNEAGDEEEEEDRGDTSRKADTTEGKKRSWSKDNPKKGKPKIKKKKFRYESKIERRATKAKQGLRNREAARARREG